jgi:hypothetical protein
VSIFSSHTDPILRNFVALLEKEEKKFALGNPINGKMFPSVALMVFIPQAILCDPFRRLVAFS